MKARQEHRWKLNGEERQEEDYEVGEERGSMHNKGGRRKWGKKGHGRGGGIGGERKRCLQVTHLQLMKHLLYQHFIPFGAMS